MVLDQNLYEPYFTKKYINFLDALHWNNISTAKITKKKYWTNTNEQNRQVNVTWNPCSLDLGLSVQ